MFSVQFSHSVVSDSLQPHELQHTRLSYLLLSPRACWNSCPLTQWCQSNTISSSIAPFCSCLQFFSAPGPFPMRWCFASGGLSIGASAVASVLPMNSQDLFPLELTALISLLSKRVWRVFSALCLYMTTGKTIDLTIWTFLSKVLISWLQSPSALILEPKKIKSVTISFFPHLFAMKWWDQMPWS